MRKHLTDNWERRESVRFPLQAKIQWRLARKKSNNTLGGVGTTIDMSSGGLLFTCDQQLRIGDSLKLALSWPVILNGSCPLQLAIRGRVVRCDSRGMAVRIDRHEFKTRGGAVNMQSAAA